MRSSSARDSGSVDMPMLLLVASVVTALSLPVFYSAYEDLSRTLALDKAQEMRHLVLSTASTVLEAHPGSHMEVDIRLADGRFAAVKEFSICGPPGNASLRDQLTISYRINGGETRSLVNDPLVRLVNTEDGRMILKGSAALRMEHIIDNGTHMVAVHRT